MERYKSVFEKLVDVLTCPRCNNMFSDPVILGCHHNICLVCAENVVSKEKGGSNHCPVCLNEAGLEDDICNPQLGKEAVVSNEMKAVISVEYSTARRLTRDTAARREDARSEASSVTGHSLASMDRPLHLTAGDPLFSDFTMELYKSAFDKVVDVLTCKRCKNLFSDPVIMDCGHNVCMTCAKDVMSKESEEGVCCPLWFREVELGRYIFNNQLGKAAVIANVVKDVIAGWHRSPSSIITSDRDSPVGSEDEHMTEASFVTAYSRSSMDHPTYMALYKSVFESLVDLLTCPQCMNLFSEPVVMECGYIICLVCAADIASKEEGRWQCPVCLRQVELGRCIFNNQLGKAAVATNVVKEVIAGGYSTVPRVTSGRDSRVDGEDVRSEICSVTPNSRASMKPPPYMALYKSAFELLVDVLTCPQCKNLFTDPVIMRCGHNICFNCGTDILSNDKHERGCYRCPLCGQKQEPGYHLNHQLGKVAVFGNEMKELILGDSSTAPGVNPDYGDNAVGSEQARSRPSSLSGYSCASMDDSLYMVPGGELACNDKLNRIHSWLTYVQGFTNYFLPDSCTLSFPITDIEPPSNTADVHDQHGGSKHQQSHLSFLLWQTRDTAVTRTRQVPMNAATFY